jgi:anti-anti-sigma factor
MPENDVNENEELFFSWQEIESDSALTLAVEGDLDLATAPTLQKAARDAKDRLAGRKLLIFDLRKVTFIDSAGLALLVETQRELGGNAEIGLLAEKGTQPDRVLHLGRFETFLKLARTPDELTAA